MKKNKRIGEENINNQGLRMWIKEYRRSDDIDVQFEDGYISKNKRYHSFKNGSINNINYPYSKIKNRVGEENTNNQGLKMKIIKYNNAKNIDILFEDGTIIKNREYTDFKKGRIKNPYYKFVYGVGYLGEGKYKSRENGEITKEYKHWIHMLQRCYSEKVHKNRLTYKNCTVCEEWHNFQNFAEWFNENYYEIEGEKMCLDKDIICHNLKLKNKIYSPNTCIFVSEKINCLFIKRQNGRGNLPIGVTYYKNNRYIAKYSYGEKCKHISIFNTPEDAFLAYKKLKENYIKKIVDEYKSKIPEKVYNELYSYDIDIND